MYDTDKRKTTKQLLGHALVSLADADLLAETDGLKWKDLDDKARVSYTHRTQTYLVGNLMQTFTVALKFLEVKL